MVKEDNNLNPTKMTKDEIDYKLRLTEVLLIIIGLALQQIHLTDEERGKFI